MVCVCLLTQGAALGYVLLPLRGVSLMSFDTHSTDKNKSVVLANLYSVFEKGI